MRRRLGGGQLGGARPHLRAQTCRVDQNRLRNQLVNEQVSSPQRIAQFPNIPLSGAFALAPQEIVKYLSENHQLPCHFVNQTALLKPRLRVHAKGTHRFGDFAVERSAIQHLRQFIKDVRQVVYELMIGEQGGQVCPAIRIDHVNKVAHERSFMLSEQGGIFFGHEVRVRGQRLVEDSFCFQLISNL